MSACRSHVSRVVAAIASLALASGCTNEVSSGQSNDRQTPAGGSVAGGSSGSSGSSGSGEAGSGAGGSGSGGGSPYLPARIRRLTNAEYDASVQALFGTSMRPSVELSFPPDARQGPSNSPAGAAFTLNDAQRVDPVLASKLDAAAQALVAEARGSGKLAELSPCADSSPAGGEACAVTFLRAFGEKAYRRPVSDEEVDEPRLATGLGLPRRRRRPHVRGRHRRARASAVADAGVPVRDRARRLSSQRRLSC